jgi:hypothetical protein
MAWTSAHFAVGMLGGGSLALAACAWRRRGWWVTPWAMTLGGLWAIVPDLPRLWREDFPSLPLASMLGDKQLERRLHSIGDLFFFHRMMDAQDKEYALHGLIGIITLYCLAILASQIRHGLRSSDECR